MTDILEHVEKAPAADSAEKKKRAFEALQNLQLDIPDDFDADKEREDALFEKYLT